MISGICQCGHLATAIHDRKDVVKLASGHGHFPLSVKLTCSCGAEFDVGPSQVPFPADTTAEEKIAFTLLDSVLTFKFMDHWLHKHQQHSDLVM